MEIVEHLKGGLLCALAHEVFPCITKVHGAEAEGANTDASGWTEYAVTPEGRGRLWGRGKERHGDEDVDMGLDGQAGVYMSLGVCGRGVALTPKS